MPYLFTCKGEVTRTAVLFIFDEKLKKLIHKHFSPHTFLQQGYSNNCLPFSFLQKNRERLILSCQLSAAEPLGHSTMKLQTDPHTACHRSPSLYKPVNSSISAIIKAFWLITPFNWIIPAAWAKWYLVSSAAEKRHRQMKN